jgi:hypothetical protein
VELNFRSGVCFPAKGLNDSRIAGPCGIAVNHERKVRQFPSDRPRRRRNRRGPLLWTRSIAANGLAVLLSFVLSPLVKLLQRLYLPRFAAVAIVVLLAFGVISGLAQLLL